MRTGILSTPLAGHLFSVPVLVVLGLVLAVLLCYWRESCALGKKPIATLIQCVGRGDTYLNAIMGTGVFVGARRLWRAIQDPYRERPPKRLQAALTTAGSDSCDAMVERCARLVQDIDKPAVIIVPSNASLDRLSRNALCCAIETPSVRDTGIIQWIVFKPEPGPGGASDLEVAAANGVCSLQHLTLCYRAGSRRRSAAGGTKCR